MSHFCNSWLLMQSRLHTAGLFPKRLLQLPYNFKPIYICFNWNRFNWITKNRTRASKLLLIPWQESRYVQTFLRGRVFLRIVIHTHAIISWCSLWALLTVRQPPISPCRTPRRCSRPRASWGRCQRRARLLESSLCNCYSKWSRSRNFLRKINRDSKTLHGFKVKKKDRMNMKMGVTREDILVDLHGGCWEGSLSLVARTTVTL